MGEEDRRLLAAHRDHGHDGNPGLEGQLDESLAPGEIDGVGLPGRAIHLPVAARVDEHRGVAVEGRAGVLVRRCNSPELPQEWADWRRENEVVGELVEGPLDPEVGVEREGEDDRVRGDVAAGMVADQQHRPFLGDPLHVPHLAAEPDARDQPGEREVLADEIGIAVVEVGGQAALDLVEEASQQGGTPEAASARTPWVSSVLALPLPFAGGGGCAALCHGLAILGARCR
jgi:hypothetical protein